MTKFEQCSVGSCRQNACLASGADQLCGDHWRDTLEHRAQEDEKGSLITTVWATCPEDLARVLETIIMKVYGDA